MSITYLPEMMLRNAAAKSLVKRLVNDDFSLNKVVLNTLARTGVISKKALEETSLRVIREYKSKYNDLINEGVSASRARSQAFNKRAQMVNRVQNLIVQEVTGSIRNRYAGQRYRWLPSNAMEPDPLHQLKYGKIFVIGVGEMPGDRWGCQCGMEILVDETKLVI